MKITGRVWKFGDNINTDLILPTWVMALPAKEQAQHMFGANRPGWAKMVQKGDIIVAGNNYGTGSSRPGARIMKELGIGCLLADTINGLFFRNCVNYALPALEVPNITLEFNEGDIAEIDFDSGRIVNTQTGKVLQSTPWPPMLLDILNAGGVWPLLESQGLLIPEN